MAKPSSTAKKKTPAAKTKKPAPPAAKPKAKAAAKAAKLAKPAKAKAAPPAKAAKAKAPSKPTAAKAARPPKASRGPSTDGLSAADAELVKDFLPRLREICLSLPETSEVEAWGHPTFRVNNKIFASYGVEGGKASMGVKTTPDMQASLVSSDPRFSIAAYVGQHGWVSLNLAGAIDLGEVENLVEGSYRLIAPGRLVRRLDEGGN